MENKSSRDVARCCSNRERAQSIVPFGRTFEITAGAASSEPGYATILGRLHAWSAFAATLHVVRDVSPSTEPDLLELFEWGT